MKEMSMIVLEQLVFSSCEAYSINIVIWIMSKPYASSVFAVYMQLAIVYNKIGVFFGEINEF